jgi:hypothetical protein
VRPTGNHNLIRYWTSPVILATGFHIQHLGELSLAGRSEDDPKYEVIACIGGRGFGVRREDMKKMILATRGKVFTAKTLDRLLEVTRLKEYKTRQ